LKATMTEETGNRGTVRSLASICARAIFRSKAKVLKSSDGVFYYPSPVLCKTDEFERFVRALTLPKTFKDRLMSYLEKNCNIGCRSKKVCARFILPEFHTVIRRWYGWRVTLNQPGCALAYGCDCCTCHHGTSCHYEHCGQSSSEASAADSGEDLEGWESSDHSVGACISSDSEEEEKDDSTDGEDEEEQYDSTDGED